MEARAVNSIRLALWNVEWAKPATIRGQLVRELLMAGSPEAICVTEGYPEIFPGTGHTILSREDHGYGTVDGRRKVMLWSQCDWTEVEVQGDAGMPSGRFVSGVTVTGLGPIRFVGVCIPWQDAHVRTGRKDRAQWEDHLQYLEGLEKWLKSTDDTVPTVLLGDFNQRIPMGRQPRHVYDRLSAVLESKFRIATVGMMAGVNQQSIDHLALSRDLEASGIEAFSNFTDDGVKLSDHFGLRVDVGRG